MRGIFMALCLLCCASLLWQPALAFAFSANARVLRTAKMTRLLLEPASVPVERRCSSAALPSKAAAFGASAGVFAALAAPHRALASAQESLDLLDGYQSLTPEWVTWTVLVGGGVWLYFRVFKFLASF